MSRHNPLADALRGVPGEDPGPLGWFSGALVTAVDLTAPPHTVTVRLPDGTSVSGVPFLGWWAPQVDARVEVLRRGTSLLVLGPVAPAGVAATAAQVLPLPPPAPEAPPSRREVTVQPTGADPAAAYDTAGGFWKVDLVQGGPTDKRVLWFYGDGIVDARAGGTVVAGSIYVERLATAHGVNGPANVRLGTHTHRSRPATAGALTAVSTVGTLQRGGGRTFPLSAAQLADLNAGAVGLGLEPGADAYDSPDYLRVTRAAPSGALSLTIEG